MTLAAAMRQDRANNLHLLRLILAAAVIISHAWPLAYGPGAAEPFKALTGHSLGGWAVVGFFFLSGLLIAPSAERSTAARFWLARARRILPGLAVALVVSLALAALSGATLTAETATTYWLRGITLVSLEHHLPGAFSHAALPGVVNGPLWSLAHEIAAYRLCLVAVRLGLLRHLVGCLGLLAFALALWAAPSLPDRALTFAPLFLAFAFGMLAHAGRGHLPLSPALTLALLALAPMGWPFAVAALGHGLLALGFRLSLPPLRTDLSFGLYIYGWPVAQHLAHHAPGISAPVLAGLSLIATLPFAMLSWHLVERPLLLRRPSPALSGA
jgi:peptidoglycan/LPS O-acetylase OafA/YrhL